MSEEPRESPQDTNLEHKEPSMTQEEPQENPQQSSLPSPTTPQDSSPSSDSCGDTSNKNNDGQGHDSGGRLVDPGTSVTSPTGSSQQVYGNPVSPGVQSEGHDISNDNPGGHQFGGNIPYLVDGIPTYKPFGSRGNSPPDSAARNSYLSVTHGISYPDRQSRSSGRTQDIGQQSGPSTSAGTSMTQDIGQQSGPTTSAGTSITNTATSTSHQESQQWSIRKRLTRSDVNSLIGQLHLSKPDVEMHLKDHLSPADFDVKVESQEGIKIKVYDQDTSTEHEMFLVREGSQNYLMRNWRQDFLIRRDLKEGEEIGLMWDPSKSMLQFSVVSRPNPNKRKSSDQLVSEKAKAAKESSQDT